MVAIELFRAYVFDAKDKSFLVPVLRSDWQTLSAGGHLSWCLWNNHTLKHGGPSDSDIDSYMTCSSDNFTIGSAFTATDLALPVDEVMNNHEVGAIILHIDAWF